MIERRVHTRRDVWQNLLDSLVELNSLQLQGCRSSNVQAELIIEGLANGSNVVVLTRPITENITSAPETFVPLDF